MDFKRDILIIQMHNFDFVISHLGPKRFFLSQALESVSHLNFRLDIQVLLHHSNMDCNFLTYLHNLEDSQRNQKKRAQLLKPLT